MNEQIKPGFFGKVVHCDERRIEYDFKNEQWLKNKKQPTAVFVGDSITNHWEIGLFCKNCTNRGVGGDTSEYLLKRFSADVLQLKPCYVIMMIGTNDISAIDGDYWWKTKGIAKAVVKKMLLENIEKIIKMCKQANQKLIICSILPTNISRPYKNAQRRSLTIEANKEILKLCRENNLIYVDYHSAMCKDDISTIKDEYSQDGIHPNAKGYEVMTKVLLNTFEKNGVQI